MTRKPGACIDFSIGPGEAFSTGMATRISDDNEVVLRTLGPSRPGFLTTP